MSKISGLGGSFNETSRENRIRSVRACAEFHVADLGSIATAWCASRRGAASHEVLTSVRSMGLDPVGRPALRGRVYVLRAFDDTQFEKRVVVDARSGAVLSVRDAINSSPAYTPYDPRYEPLQPPRPPASIARAEPPPDMEPLLDEPLFPRSARVAPARGVRCGRPP